MTTQPQRRAEPFARLLIGTEPVTLKALAVRAVQTANHVSEGYRCNAGEYDMDRREAEAIAARTALLDHLLYDHGIGTALANEMGAIL